MRRLAEPETAFGRGTWSTCRDVQDSDKDPVPLAGEGSPGATEVGRRPSPVRGGDVGGSPHGVPSGSWAKSLLPVTDRKEAARMKHGVRALRGVIGLH